MSCSNIQETRFFYCISLELEQFRNVGKIKKTLKTLIFKNKNVLLHLWLWKIAQDNLSARWCSKCDVCVQNVRRLKCLHV